MKRILTISFTLAMLASMFVLLGFIRKEHNKSVCRSIRISIEYHSSDTLVCNKEIKRLLISRLDTLEGKMLHAEHLSNIRKVIAGIPYIEKCDVDFLLNGTLRIRAKQRVPMLRIMADNHSWFIDDQGIVMPRHKTFSALVPVAGGHLGKTGVLRTGNNLMALADTNMTFKAGRLYQVVNLARYIHKDPFLSSMVEQIYINPDGEIELFTHVSNQRIIFGDVGNIGEKFNKLLIFYHAGPSVTGLHQYKTINLKYNNQVVCSKT